MTKHRTCCSRSDIDRAVLEESDQTALHGGEEGPAPWDGEKASVAGQARGTEW